MYVISITLKAFETKFFKICCAGPITKVNEGESNTPCPSTLEADTPQVEKLSKALLNHV
jgi:hypothetical protein